MKSGVLPDWRIKELIATGVIPGADPALVNTSSLDLRVGFNRWKLHGSFLPREDEKVEDALGSGRIVDGNSQSGTFYFETFQPYAVALVESLDLPGSIRARVFNKSGRGRIGVSLRGLSDGTPSFDHIRNGYRGGLYAEISSTVYPLVVYPGQTTIPQIRFYEGDPEPMSGSELELLLRTHPILTNDQGERAYTEREREEMIRTGKITFTADISADGLLAYVGVRDRRTLDLSQRNFYDPADFFTEVRAPHGRGGSILIHPGDFVLIHSKENIRLPPVVAAEIDEYSPELGDMKTHYAGLINATHGYYSDGRNVPSHIVFEVRARDQPIIIRDGQSLARFNLLRMLGEPEGNYMDVRSTGFGSLREILPAIFKKE